MKRMIQNKGCFVGLFLMISFLLNSQTNTREELEIEKKIDQFVLEQMKLDKVPGLTIGYLKGDKIWVKGYGYADLENKQKAMENSSYRLASTSKSMTAVAILQLAQKGKINLDAEVQTYVPFFPRKKWPVTIRQLLGHLGGISHYRDYLLEGHIKEHKDTRDALEIFSGFDLVAEPGTKYSYTSYGYNLLGAVVEFASKEPYGDYLHRHIWEPLGMTHTYMDDPMEIIPQRVRGYQIKFGEVKNSEFIDISSRFAAGGSRSTVKDLLKYARGLQDGKIVSEKSTLMMETSMISRDGLFTDYGMGWGVIPVNGHFQASHTGGQQETRTLLMRFPSNKMAIALAYNLEGGQLRLYGQRLFEILASEVWGLKVYTPQLQDIGVLKGLNQTFNYGLSYFEKYGKQLESDPNLLTKAFHYLNKSLSSHFLESQPKEALKKINEGRHPKSGQAYVQVGSFIAKSIIQHYGPERKKLYHRMGSIVFFNDYINLCKSGKTIDPSLFFSKELEEKLMRWKKDWKKTCTSFTLNLNLSPNSDSFINAKKLKKIFAGRQIYPDFRKDFSRVIRDFYISYKVPKAIQLGKIYRDLYPQSAGPQIFLANAYLCAGQADKTRELYKKALQTVEGKQMNMPPVLKYFVLDFYNRNRLDQAMALSTIGMELFPKEGGFYELMGDIYLEKAKRHYKKSLKLDPTLKNPGEILKKIK
jgi:CubicO group peptidase (beta-lactamase class C family)